MKKLLNLFFSILFLVLIFNSSSLAQINSSTQSGNNASNKMTSEVQRMDKSEFVKLLPSATIEYIYVMN